MTTRNDITGDAIKSRASTKEFRDNFARIKFGVREAEKTNKLPQHPK